MRPYGLASSLDMNGYREEGPYVNDKKHGKWVRQYFDRGERQWLRNI